MATVLDELDVEQAGKIRDRLVARLHKQRGHYFRMLGWYMGEQAAPGLPREATGEVYRRIRESSRNTWAALIVDSIAERLELEDYRSGSNDRELELQLRDLFDANLIDDEQWQPHVDALLGGRGYVSVGEPMPDDPDVDELPVVIVPESPLEVVHEWFPGSRRIVWRALKVYELEPGYWRAELTTPSQAFAWQAQIRDDRELHPFTGARPPWDVAGVSDGVDEVPNELGVVPIVPFENRRTTATGPLSEVAQVEHVLQRIDELLVGKQTASHFAAFRQRWATGLELPRDPETGLPVEPFKAAVSRLWVAEEGDAKFGSFEATDLGQYTQAIEAEVAELAAVSKVPAHYFLQSSLANPPSADALTAGEAGLVKKCRRRQRGFGESWRRVARLALLVAGVERASIADARLAPVWVDPRVLSPAQVADAATKERALGVPDVVLWERIGASPEDVERWRALRDEQDLRTAALGLQLPAPTDGVAPPIA